MNVAALTPGSSDIFASPKDSLFKYSFPVILNGYVARRRSNGHPSPPPIPNAVYPFSFKILQSSKSSSKVFGASIPASLNISTLYQIISVESSKGNVYNLPSEVLP